MSPTGAGWGARPAHALLPVGTTASAAPRVRRSFARVRLPQQLAYLTAEHIPRKDSKWQTKAGQHSLEHSQIGPAAIPTDRDVSMLMAKEFGNDIVLDP